MNADLLEKKAWTQAYVNGLPDSAFAVVSGGGEKDEDGRTKPRSLRHLPFRDASGSTDLAHLRNALARLDQIDASDADKAKARKILQAAAKEAGIGQAAEKMEHAAMTFDDAMMRRKARRIYEALGEQYGALMETLNSIQSSDDEDKMTSMKQAMTDFADSVRTSMPKMIADIDEDDDMEKAGRKISADRMAKLKIALKTLTDIIAEQEMDMAEKKVDASTMSKLGSRLAALFAPAMGADAETVTALEKAAAGTSEPPIPDSVQAVLSKANDAIAKLEAANTTQAAELKTNGEALVKAQAELAAMKEQADLRKFADEVAGYKEIGLDPAKDAQLLKSIDEKLPKEMADRIRELFKAQLAQKAAAGLMTEIGSSGAGPEPSSAVAQVETKMGELMAKTATLTAEAARSAVFTANPGLYERWRDETLVRI